MPYSEEVRTLIVQAHKQVADEIMARDVVFRRDFDEHKRRHVPPWSLVVPGALQEEEFDLWIKLHVAQITESQAIELMTDLMEQYYGQTYLLRNRHSDNANCTDDIGSTTEGEFTILGEILSHPGAFQECPYLPKLPVKLLARQRLANGDVTAYRTDGAGREWIDVAREASPDVLRAALLREVQLAIIRAAGL